MPGDRDNRPPFPPVPLPDLLRVQLAARRRANPESARSFDGGECGDQVFAVERHCRPLAEQLSRPTQAFDRGHRGERSLIDLGLGQDATPRRRRRGGRHFEGVRPGGRAVHGRLQRPEALGGCLGQGERPVDPEPPRGRLVLDGRRQHHPPRRVLPSAFAVVKADLTLPFEEDDHLAIRGHREHASRILDDVAVPLLRAPGARRGTHETHAGRGAGWPCADGRGREQSRSG